MKAIPIKFTVQQILELTNQLSKEIKKHLIKKWSQEFKKEPEPVLPPNLPLEGYNDAFDLEKSALKETELKPLQDLWKEELPAEELVKMCF